MDLAPAIWRHACRWRKWSLVGVGLGLLGLAGCGSSNHPVSGTVQLSSGETLSNGTITLYPDMEGGIPSDKLLFGKVEADGKYTIELDGTRGAPPGKYRVTVSAATEERPPGVPANPLNYYPLVDAVYREPDTTPLRIEVVANPEPTAYDLVVSPVP